MKILYYFRQENKPMHLWQNYHFIEELSHYNIAIEIFNPLHYQSIDKANEELLRHIKTGDYSLFMTCHNEELLYIDTLAQINRWGIPSLLICFDNLLIPYEHRKICPLFDLVWLTAIETKSMFERWGANTIFLPYAANPFTYVYKRCKEVNRIVFNGTPYGSRANTINSIIGANIPIDVYGQLVQGKAVIQKHTPREYCTKATRFLSFPIGRKVLVSALIQQFNRDATVNRSDFITLNPGVSFSDIPTLYSQYALSLSITSARDTGILKKPVDVVNLRCFEIPMSGGVSFCRYNEELSRYFAEDKEIVFYRDKEEMIEKAKFYLSEEKADLRERIRNNARIKAEAEHNWMSRFEQVFNALGFCTNRTSY